jgi:hypothetical protein
MPRARYEQTILYTPQRKHIAHTRRPQPQTCDRAYEVKPLDVDVDDFIIE